MTVLLSLYIIVWVKAGPLNKTSQSIALKYTAYVAFIILPILIFLTSCRLKQEQKPSIYLVAMDGLSVSDLSCSEETKSLNHSGIAVMCQESVRFSHMYTTSTLSTPAMTSVLTGLYPFDHAVHHNGDSWLSPFYETAAEVAFQKNYSTFFISGSPAITRKSGLNQGFDFFDDLFISGGAPGSNTATFRPFEQAISIFKNWYKDSNDARFAVFYLPDLLYSNQETKNEFGQDRNLSYESQLENFDFHLYNLIEFLKKNNQWNSSYFILVGLNGQNKIHGQLPKWTNLYSEMSQVTLLIKPQQKPRDLGINWSVDETLSLADLGQTLFDILNKQTLSSSYPALETQSLLPFLTNSDVVTTKKLVYTESAWTLDNSYLPHNIALRDDKYLYISNATAKLYNSLIDRFETSPLGTEDRNSFDFLKSAKGLVDLLPKEKLQKNIPRSLFDLGLESWTRKEGLSGLVRDEDFRFLNRQEINWLELEGLLKSDWDLLKKIAKTKDDKDLNFLIEQNFKPDKKDNFVGDACLSLAYNQIFTGPLVKNCEDSLTLSLFDWVNFDLKNDSAKKDSAKRKFLKQYETQMNEIKILKINYGLGNIWDVNDRIKDTRSTPSPKLTRVP